jgi:ribosomal protein S5
VPRGILEEFAHPLDFTSGEDGSGEAKVSTLREAAMSPSEHARNEQRKRLRELIEKPAPIVTRPMWPLYALITGADQVTQVVKGGMVQTMRCMVVVGNGMGGIGVGVAKHKDSASATKAALNIAMRDMIHVATHKGQLFHDLIGRKNNVYVSLRTMPAGSNLLRGAPLVLDILELAGVTAASAKIFGSHRRNPYVVTQAIFDSFNHHTSPDDDAARRGLRISWNGYSKIAPRLAFPSSARGPRFPAANDRYVKGNQRV